jgi:hypothetical protein
MTLERAAPVGVGRGIGARLERARVAFGESLGIKRGARLGGTSTDGGIFFGLLSRRKRVSGGLRTIQPTIIPTRHPIATSVNTRRLNKALPLRAVLLITADFGVAGAGVETTGVGVIRSGAASAAAGAPQSA